MIVPFEILFETLICRVLLLCDEPCQIRLGVLGSCLIFRRFPWSGFHFWGWFLDDPIDKGQRLHARVCQVILLLVLVENGKPMRLRLLNKGATPLDRRLFALEVPRTSWTSDVRHLVSRVVHNDVLVVTQKVRV